MPKAASFSEKISDADAISASKIRSGIAKIEMDIAAVGATAPDGLEDIGAIVAGIERLGGEIRAAQADHAAHPGRSGDDYVAAVGPLKEARKAAKADLLAMTGRNDARWVASRASQEAQIKDLQAKKADAEAELAAIYETVEI